VHLLLSSCSSSSFAERLVAFACVEGIFFSGRYAANSLFSLHDSTKTDYICFLLVVLKINITCCNLFCSQLLCYLLAEKERVDARIGLLK